MKAPARIRLLQIVDSLHPGGMENIMVKVCNHLNPSRFEVSVCCLRESGPFAQRLRPEVSLCSLGKKPGFQWNTVRQLRRLMKDGCDVVHTHHLGGLIYAALARGGSARPALVHSEHILWDQDELGLKRQWQRRALYPLCACVFTLSKQQRQQMQCLNHSHPWQVTLPNGVDTLHFQPAAHPKDHIRRHLGLDPGGFWVGKVARYGKTKRHMELIEGFEQAAAASPSLRLLLVGDGGPEKPRVLERIAKSPAKCLIHVAGFQQDPALWYQAMDILMIASSYEGLPNAVLEGMACGLPVVANEACGVRELARDGEHGWIGNFSTAGQLAEALRAAANTPAARLKAMGDAACSHARQHFSIETMLGKYERLYTAAAQGDRDDLDTVRK